MPDFFKKPSVLPPDREKEFEYRPEESKDVPIDVSAETLEDVTEPQNPFRRMATRVAQLQRKNRRLRTKTKGTIAYHVADLNLTIGVDTPPHIRDAIYAVYGITIPKDGTIDLTDDQLQCAINIMQNDDDAQKAADAVDNSAPDEGGVDFAINLIADMAKQKYSFGLEFLLRLIRMCLAYAVHMIIGGLCSFFLGKLSIPIPMLGSLPLGTMIAMQILAPVERQAKAALGFPCLPNHPLPDFCFDLFVKDQDKANLLPCCIPAGLSGMALRMQEMKSKMDGGSPLSSNIDSFLKSFEVKGGFKDGYISYGDAARITIDKDITKLMAEEDEGDGIKSAMNATKESLSDFNEQQKAIMNGLKDSTKTVAAFGKAEILGGVSKVVDSWFACIAQGLAGIEHFEPGKEYEGPPCADPSNPSNSSAGISEQANQIVEYLGQRNSTPTEPKATNSLHILNLISVMKRTEHMDENLGDLKYFLKDNEDLLNPATKRCLEGSANLSFGGPNAFSKLNDLMDPEKFFDKLDTDNDMSNIQTSPEGSTQIGGGDVMDMFTGGLGDAGFKQIGDTMQGVVDGLETLIAKMDEYVSSVNKLAKWFSSREFCCVIYMIVLLANVARGQMVCPNDDISSFFKYSAEISDKRNVAVLKMQLALLKAIIDAIRESLAIGFEIKGVTIPLKDLMEQVRKTVTNIADVLIDAAAQPFESSLDQLLLNPDISAMLANNCFYAFDIMSILKCALEWLKLKIKMFALDIFENNFHNIELLRTLKVGGLKFSILDMLSGLLDLCLKLLLGIGDCYDGDDYMRSVVGATLEQQYSDAERVYTILDKANVTPAEMDRWSQTLEQTDPFSDIDLSDPEIAEFSADLDDFQGTLLTEKLVDLVRNAAPISTFAADDAPRRLVSYEEFVSKLEEYSGTTLSEVYIDLYKLDSGIFKIFEGTSQ